MRDLLDLFGFFLCQLGRCGLMVVSGVCVGLVFALLLAPIVLLIMLFR